MAEHAKKHGGQALSEAELREIFRDFDSSGSNKARPGPFLFFYFSSLGTLKKKALKGAFIAVFRDFGPPGSSKMGWRAGEPSFVVVGGRGLPRWGTLHSLRHTFFSSRE